MCLIKIHIFPKISSKPITVYKVLIRQNGALKTPFTEKIVKCGDTIKAARSWWRGIFTFYIGGEGVHAYTSLYKAYRDIIIGRDAREFIFEAVISPYTPYWLGFNGDIAASKMKIIKEL